MSCDHQKSKLGAVADGFWVAELRVRQVKIGSKSCFGRITILVMITSLHQWVTKDEMQSDQFSCLCEMLIEAARLDSGHGGFSVSSRRISSKTDQINWLRQKPTVADFQ